MPSSRTRSIRCAQYFDRGMNVVLNTDNRLMSGTTLTDEYVHAATTLGFSFDELSDDRAERIRERVPALGGTRAADRSRDEPTSPRSAAACAA